MIRPDVLAEKAGMLFQTMIVIGSVTFRTELDIWHREC
jgi:hypothetical protein